jgi:hypothetical protein
LNRLCGLRGDDDERQRGHQTAARRSQRQLLRQGLVT